MTGDDILKQHKQIFVEASRELVINNTLSLVEDDIIKGVITPPLDTMDLIKQRILNIAKNNKIILKTDSFNKYLNNYKSSLSEYFHEFGKKRQDFICNYLDKFDDEKPLNLVKGLNRELIKFNKELKKESKNFIVVNLDKEIIKNIDKISDDGNLKFKKEALKYLQSLYVKQLLEALEMKLLVKDTILLNSLKEQIERFVFTKENSHLFD
mgnify:FL=1